MEDLSEKEQLEAMRAWWAENGRYIIAGVIVGVVTIFGYNRWQSGITESQVTASVLYEDIMEATGRGDLDAASTAATELYANYESTPYAAQARLAMARLYMDKSRDQDAANVLQAVIDLDSESEIGLVARLRLAKILLYQDKPQEAVDLLKDRTDHAFAARFSEALGDAYVALGSYADAEAAYIAALNDNPAARTVDVNTIQLKLNDLPADEEVPEPAAEEASESEAEAEAGSDQ